MLSVRRVSNVSKTHVFFETLLPSLACFASFTHQASGLSSRAAERAQGYAQSASRLNCQRTFHAFICRRTAVERASKLPLIVYMHQALKLPILAIFLGWRGVLQLEEPIWRLKSVGWETVFPLCLHRAGRGNAFQRAPRRKGSTGQRRNHEDVRTAAADTVRA